MFDRICEQGKFTEKDASQTIKQVLEAVDYLHRNNVVHRGMYVVKGNRVSCGSSCEYCTDLKPENLLYLTKESNSKLVLADFGIAKMLDSKDEVLTTMAGSFGYAAPEVMLKKGHGKAVDMWSMGVITYTLLCGYSPFRSENLQDLIEECSNTSPVFHERYWKDVSQDAKDFIGGLLKPAADDRWTSQASQLYPVPPVPAQSVMLTIILQQQALSHRWLTGTSATDHNLLPEIKAYMAKARLRRGIELVKLANRIEALKIQEDDPENPDFPADPVAAADSSRGSFRGTSRTASDDSSTSATGEGKPEKRNLSKMMKGAIFREVVLAKVREMKEQEQTLKVREEVEKKEAKRRSFQG